eukprot:Sspe_Gene.12343::Locus_4205_Transcript_1_2_Confidence_0.667_Length_1457::g.12343::m.12343
MAAAGLVFFAVVAGVVVTAAADDSFAAKEYRWIVMSPATTVEGPVESLHWLCDEVADMVRFARMAYVTDMTEWPLSAVDSPDDETRNGRFACPQFEPEDPTQPLSSEALCKEKTVLVWPGTASPAIIGRFTGCYHVVWWLTFPNADGTDLWMQPPTPDGTFHHGLVHASGGAHSREGVESILGVMEGRVVVVRDALKEAATLHSLGKMHEWEKRPYDICWHEGVKPMHSFMTALTDFKIHPIAKEGPVTASQLVDELVKCKLYIDFSKHNTESHILRKAALLGCGVVISGYGAGGRMQDYAGLPRDQRVVMDEVFLAMDFKYRLSSVAEEIRKTKPFQDAELARGGQARSAVAELVKKVSGEAAGLETSLHEFCGRHCCKQCPICNKNLRCPEAIEAQVSHLAPKTPSPPTYYDPSIENKDFARNRLIEARKRYRKAQEMLGQVEGKAKNAEDGEK